MALNPDLDDEGCVGVGRQFADGDQDGDGVAETEPVNVVVLVPGDRDRRELGALRRPGHLVGR
ncbi:hypothetical protein [Streptomyces violaceus]|uniref:Uncharacterized protein n=1 Tax=Streptomyces violaceus TaxID=1936 RepID=A0ABY9U6C2_STRVL|nr:hypothetical protein [Streptomyces janthinus]WND15861.1 hypothetical protein RI060_00020 [Streptomyces janthinus]